MASSSVGPYSDGQGHTTASSLREHFYLKLVKILIFLQPAFLAILAKKETVRTIS